MPTEHLGVFFPNAVVSTCSFFHKDDSKTTINEINANKK